MRIYANSEDAMQIKTAKKQGGMNIIIVGGGKVGHELISCLVNEGHDITVVDTDEQVIQDITELYDVMGIRRQPQCADGCRA